MNYMKSPQNTQTDALQYEGLTKVKNITLETPYNL